LVRQLGTTTLMVTHSLDQALTYGDRLVMLHEGRLIGDWTAAERETLNAEALRGFYGSATMVDQTTQSADGPASP
jgi:putative ABC transport system ATP-binding protein